MGKFVKWIGGGLGWAFFGPVGGMFGFLLGTMVDSIETVHTTSGKTTSGDYAMSLLVLVAAMMKADGKVMKAELDYVKKFLIQNFGAEGAQEALQLLRDLLKQEIPVEDVCDQISAHVDYSSRLQLMHFLFGLAYSDGRIHIAEERLLELISYKMGITSKDKESLRSMFKNTIEDYYKILEVDSKATDEDIKKAYRSMAMKYHPDKVAYLGNDVKNAANEKFQKLNEAYEKIKKERGMV